MKIRPSLLVAAATAGASLPLIPSSPRAADPDEVPKNVIAVQIRKQGYPCDSPQSAERDPEAGNPDDPVWTLKCANAIYRVHLIPNMAAKVERVSGDRKTAEQP